MLNEFKISRITFYRIILSIFSSILILSCANPLPPPGGPPDTSPPLIIETKPINGSTNYKGNEIVIRFNKYMNRPKVIENLYFSPPIRNRISWSGKKLIIKILEPLDSSLTYTINLGTEYEDYLGNKPETGFSLIFSPGDKIDSASITGILFGEKREGAFIYAYRIDNIDADTLDVRKTKSIYRIQIGKTGKFEIKALAEGIYRIIAVNDVFRNEIYDEGIDLFGAALDDVKVRFDSIPKIFFKLGPIIDKSGPLLYNVESLNSRFIAVTFSEDIDSASVKPASFILTDSSGIDTINIISAYFLHNSAKKIELITEQEIQTDRKWQIICPSNENGIKDLAGNIINDTANSKIFIARDIPDTIKPKIISTPFPDSSLKIKLATDFIFVFNVGIDSSKSELEISLIDAKDTTRADFNFDYPMENIIRVNPKKQLESDKWYRLSLDVIKLVAKNGKSLLDTTIELNFKTEDLRQYGSISGKIKYKENTHKGDFYVIARNIENQIQYKTKADNAGLWKFDNIAAGKYNFEVFIDENENGKYDFGDSFPFKYAEKFKFYELEVNVKARWETENIILNFD